jgi:hypothetical protein
MQTDITNRTQAEIESQPKQIVHTLDPDIQTLILEWVIPCLIDAFLNRHHELKFERQMQPADPGPIPLSGADCLQRE